MPCTFADEEEVPSWLFPLFLVSSLLLQEELGGIGRSGFIWDDEPSLDEAVPDFMVKSKGY